VVERGGGRRRRAALESGVRQWRQWWAGGEVGWASEEDEGVVLFLFGISFLEKIEEKKK